MRAISALRRPTVLAALALAAAAALSVTPAGAVSPRFEPDPQANLFLPAGDFCSFDALFEVTEQNRTKKTFADQDGNVTMVITTGTLKGTVTNLETRASMSLDISGQITLFPRADGSFIGFIEGPTLVTFVPGELSYATGETIFRIPAGETEKVFISHLGKTVDICAALAV